MFGWDSRSGHALALTTTVLVCLSMAYLSAGRPEQSRTIQPPTPESSSARGAFRADVALRQGRVRIDGRPVGPPAPAISFRIERARRPTGWRTTMTLRGFDQPLVESATGTVELDNPFLITRVEYDEANGEPRFYNSRGVRVPQPTAADRVLFDLPSSRSERTVGVPSSLGERPRQSAVAPDDWAAQIVATPGARADRQSSFERQLGRPQGRVAGLDRYLATNGDTTREVLVNPEAVVPVEVNTVSRGQLVARTTFGYDQHPNGAWVRKLLRSERVVPNASGLRSVLDVAVTNVVFERGDLQ
jgi:hypothetical protein